MAIEKPVLTRAEQINKRQRAVRDTITAAISTAIPDTANFGAIFFFHLSRDLLNILFNTFTRFVVFPAAGLFSMIKAGFSWHIWRHDLDENDKPKTLNLIQAIWDTLQSGGIMGAVITGIVTYLMGTAALAAMGISITFSVLLGTGTLYQAALTGYFALKARAAYQAWEKESPEKDMSHAQYQSYKQYRSAAIHNAIVTGIVAMLCVGVTIAMVAGFPFIGGVIGVATCLAAIAYTAFGLYKHLKSQPTSADTQPLLEASTSADDDVRVTKDAQLSQGARLLQHFGKHRSGAKSNHAERRQPTIVITPTPPDRTVELSLVGKRIPSNGESASRRCSIR